MGREEKKNKKPRMLSNVRETREGKVPTSPKGHFPKRITSKRC